MMRGGELNKAPQINVRTVWVEISSVLKDLAGRELTSEADHLVIWGLFWHYERIQLHPLFTRPEHPVGGEGGWRCLAFTLNFFTCLTPGTGSAVSRAFEARGQTDSPGGRSRFKLCLGPQKYVGSVPQSGLGFGFN